MRLIRSAVWITYLKQSSEGPLAVVSRVTAIFVKSNDAIRLLYSGQSSSDCRVSVKLGVSVWALLSCMDNARSGPIVLELLDGLLREFGIRHRRHSEGGRDDNSGVQRTVVHSLPLLYALPRSEL